MLSLQKKRLIISFVVVIFMKKGIIMLLIVVGMLFSTEGRAQSLNRKMTLTDVIYTAHEQSPSALVAKHNFLGNYWAYRSYKAQFLPSLNLGATLGNFNRSLMALQNSETGNIKYVENNNMRNNLTLSLDQNIALTGGKVSVFTQLSRLDQYAPERNITYNSQPINITYIQPLRAFNSLKWQKKTQPKEYEKAKRSYLETMEDITVTATSLFFNALLSQRNLERAQKNYQNTETLYRIAKERFELGKVTKSELLQLELRLLNDGLSINQSQLNLDMNQLKLKSYLGYNESVQLELVLPDSIPELALNVSEVVDLSYANSSFGLSQELSVLYAEQSVAEAKANRGLSATLSAQFGLTQQNESFKYAYKNPMDQEIISLGLSLPIMDWGLGKGRVKTAKSRENVVRTQTNQEDTEHRQDIMIKVVQFNNQIRQCKISAMADSVAEQRYEMVMERFINGTADVTDLNTAQSEKDEAANRYIQELNNYWSYYYNIRRLTLFDYISRTNISAEFDKIVGK